MEKKKKRTGDTEQNRLLSIATSVRIIIEQKFKLCLLLVEPPSLPQSFGHGGCNSRLHRRPHPLLTTQCLAQITMGQAPVSFTPFCYSSNSVRASSVIFCALVTSVAVRSPTSKEAMTLFKSFSA
ncbi:hypothetical protein CEXT_810771 [Caerostris extrusa]|uniref:Uncharacterized protein n=1 Tax=Caerostris extrusa TaxID=172846 RepID=A0AAV4WVF0_CAEEX|nr:hypothetical protein CEXT_810771 [Caerostris extrusa]